GDWDSVDLDANCGIDHGGEKVINSFIRITGDWEDISGIKSSSNIIARNYNTFASGGTLPSDGNYGDITVISSGIIWTINNNVVDNDKLADMPRFTINSRTVDGSENPDNLTATEVTAMLDQFGALKGL